MTWEHPSRNPARGRTLQRISMVIGNEVTLSSLSRRAWSRCQPYGRQGGILQEANASGKARGYADVKAMTESVKLPVANGITQGYRCTYWWKRREETQMVSPLLPKQIYRALAVSATYP
jgi:hypothetical protein